MVETSTNQFQPTSHLFVAYGSKNLSILCNFFDAYMNPITTLLDTDVFGATIPSIFNSGTFVLIASKVGNQLQLSLQNSDIKVFSRLVIKENYQILLTYTNLLDSGATFSKYLPFDVTGDPSVTFGAGNGPFVSSSLSLTSVEITAG